MKRPLTVLLWLMAAPMILLGAVPPVFGNDWNGVSLNTTMVDVTLGSYILLPCNPPMANPTPMVTWTRDSSPIAISTTEKYKVLPSGDLIVGNVVMDDIGDTYRCHVVNRLIFETIDSPYSYQLRQVDRYSENLTIYNTLGNTFLQIGSNAELVCLAIANDITRLDYFYNRAEFQDLDDNMRGPTSTPITNIDRRHTLFIDGVREDNAGEYVCSVGDFVTGSTVQLHLVPFNISVFAPPMITSFPGDITMYTGDSIAIPCVVTGLPAPSISYRVNTNMLSVTDGMLTNVSVTDSGAYQCFVENIHGVVTASWTITVRDPAAPLIVNMSGDGTVPEYGDLDIFIEVSADPMPSVDWLLNGVRFNSLDRQMLTMRQYNTAVCPVTYLLELRVINFTASDSGQYSIVITNRAGTIQPSFTHLLEVPAAVTEVKGVGDSCIIRNENTNLTCLVTGVPTPTIQWFRSGGDNDRVTITTDSKYTVMGNILIINNVINGDADRYGCTATNIVDGMERTATAADTFSVCESSTTNGNSELLVVGVISSALTVVFMLLALLLVYIGIKFYKRRNQIASTKYSMRKETPLDSISHTSLASSDTSLGMLENDWRRETPIEVMDTTANANEELKLDYVMHTAV
ncbi:peroxidasin-like isoform X2 [Dysidea avara]|uniref:peroxidasin-like isoform X2 n=1 Tax=Dysidea avara TaxID=196820 RepID=UPI003327047E